MADVLSQSEVETLLSALDPGSSDSQPSGGSRHRDGGIDAQVSLYDFKRPERVSKEQMRAFQALHDGFSREFGATLSGMLRTIVEVKLISVDQLTYSEFVFSLENPTCFNLLWSAGLEGSIILDLNPSIIFPMFDRLLGGGRTQHTHYPSRPLTGIELKLLTRITDQAISGLEKSWAKLCALDLSVTQVESNPQLIQIVPPNEVIVLISFEVTMGDVRGIMNLCMPFNTIEPLSGKLSSDTWSSYTKRAVDPSQQLNLESGIKQAKVEMIVQLAATKLTSAELRGLGVGDVIMTEQPVGGGLSVYVEGRPMFFGSPGAYKGHKAVQIGRPIPRPQDEVSRQLEELLAKKTAEPEQKKAPVASPASA
jgi:flagellar motor switch protein FliM